MITMLYRWMVRQIRPQRVLVFAIFLLFTGIYLMVTNWNVEIEIQGKYREIYREKPIVPKAKVAGKTFSLDFSNARKEDNFSSIDLSDKIIVVEEHHEGGYQIEISTLNVVNIHKTNPACMPFYLSGHR